MKLTDEELQMIRNGTSGFTRDHQVEWLLDTIDVLEFELAQARIEAGAATAKLAAGHVGNFKMAPGDKWDTFIDALLHRLETDILSLASTDALAQHDEELLGPVRELVDSLKWAIGALEASDHVTRHWLLTVAKIPHERARVLIAKVEAALPTTENAKSAEK